MAPSIIDFGRALLISLKVKEPINFPGGKMLQEVLVQRASKEQGVKKKKKILICTVSASLNQLKDNILEEF